MQQQQQRFSPSAAARRHAIIPPRVTVAQREEHEVDITEDVMMGDVDGQDTKQEEPEVEEIDMTLHYTKTIIDQAHLCPLPMASNPIYWKYDHPMRLYPIPDAVIAGDSVDQYEHRYQECDVLNPGSFPVDCSFAVYRPVDVNEDNNEVTGKVELSRID